MGQLVVFVKVCLVLLVASVIFCALIKKSESRWLMGKPLMITVVAFPIASMANSFWILFILLFLVLPMIARSGGEAVGLYVVALISLPIVNSTIIFGSSTIVTLDSYMALSMGLFLCSLLKSKETVPRTSDVSSSSFYLPVLSLLLIEIIGFSRGLNMTSVGRTVIEQTLAIGLPYYAIVKSISTKKDINRTIIAFCFAVTVQAIIAVYETKTSWPIYEGLQRSLGFHLNISQATKMRAGFMRANGTFPESTSFAWVLVLALTGTICMRSYYRSTLHFGAAIFVICFGLLACQARAGWLAAAVGIILIDVYRSKIFLATFKCAIFAGIYALIVAVQGYYDRLSAFAASGTQTYDYRVKLFTRGLEEISKHPIIGNDLASVMINLKDLKQGEGIIDFVNAYIYITLVTGIIGLVIFFAQFIYVQVRMYSARRRFIDDQSSLVGAWVFAVSGLTMIAAYTSGFGGSVVIFYIMALAVGSRLWVLCCRPVHRVVKVSPTP